MLLQILIALSMLYFLVAVPVTQTPRSTAAAVRVKETSNNDIILGLTLEKQLLIRYCEWGELPTTLTTTEMEQMGLSSTLLTKIDEYSWDEKKKIFYLRIKINEGEKIWLSPCSGQVLP